MKDLFTVDFDEDEENELRTRLLHTQRLISEKNLPVVLVFFGISGGGKSSTFNHLRGWANARLIKQNAYEKKLPSHDIPYRRFWRDLPPAGEIGVYLSSWYTFPIIEKAHHRMDNREFKRHMDEARSFEKTLADNGYIILKYWLHMSKKKQEKYLEYLESDDELKWKVTDYDHDSLKYYDELKETTEEAIKQTDEDYAPWVKINEETREQRVSATLSSFCSTMEKLVKKPLKFYARTEKASKILPKQQKISLSSLDFSQSLCKKDYEKQLKHLRSRLNQLFMKAREAQRKIVLCFEGPDASGKGGVISRLSSSLNPRYYNIFPISAPSLEEKRYHHLWRFWTRLTEQKLLSIFDRSWYGRVLVERIEGFTDENLWLKAYEEINLFEKELYEAGNIVVKYLLYISKDEQFKRFEVRKDTDYKKWKITEEDWRNREKWDEYDRAFEDMITLTDTPYAPWFVIPSDNKKFSRITAMQMLVKVLEYELD